MRRGFLLDTPRAEQNEDEETRIGALIAPLGQLLHSQGLIINPEKTAGGLIFDPSWLGQDAIPAGETSPQTSASIQEPQNAAPTHPETDVHPGSQDTEGSAHPGNGEKRKARCSELATHMGRNIAMAAATAYLGGPSFLAGCVGEKSPIIYRRPSE